MLFKALQVCFGNVDIGYALILTDQLLNGLLAGGLFMLQRRFPRLPLTPFLADGPDQAIFAR